MDADETDAIPTAAAELPLACTTTTGGQVTGTSRSLKLTPDENANLQLSCVPVHPSVGGSVTCTARSDTGEGALLTFQQGDWRTTIRTVRNWTHHTIDVPATTDANARETDITVTLINRSREAIDSETLKLSMTGSLLGAELDTSSPPPQMYAFPAVNDQPCPDGWGRSWQAWASANVCELFTYFNTTTGQYDVTFNEAQETIKRYTARTREAESPSEEGTVVQLENRQWTVLDTQKVFFSNDSDTGFDSRDREILERVIAVESTYPGAIVAVSGYADTITVRNERIDAVNNVLTARGVPAPDITITPGDPSASPDMERVDFAILAPTDTPTVTLDPTSGPLGG